MNTSRGAEVIIIATIYLLCISIGNTPASEKSNEDINNIVDSLKVGAFGLDVSKLLRASEKEWPQPTTKEDVDKLLGKNGMIIVRYPKNDPYEDAYSYYIFFKPRTREYWIWRRGGFAVVSEFYGPGILPLSSPK